MEVPFTLDSTSWVLLHNVLSANFDGGYEFGYINSATTMIHGPGGQSVRVTCKNDWSDEENVTDAGVVIGADVPSSTTRTLLLPETKRNYAGYLAW